MTYTQQELTDIKRLSRIGERIATYPNGYQLETLTGNVTIEFIDNHLVCRFRDKTIYIYYNQVVSSQGNELFPSPRLASDTINDNYMKAIMPVFGTIPPNVSFKSKEALAIRDFLNHNLNLRNKLNF